MIRKMVLAAILATVSSPCRAQLNCTPTSTKLACIIPNQFQFQVASQGQSAALAFANNINASMASQVSELPLASPASGVIYENDPRLNTPVPSNATLGPILTQRAETIGNHKYYLAYTYQYFSFNVDDGVSLRSMPLFFNLINGTAVTATNNRLDLKANQYTIYFTYGLTRHMDVSVAVPILSVSERLITSGNEYDLTNPKAPVTPIPNFSQSGSVTASGIGDVTFAAKYWLWRPERGGGLTVGAELRTPTGDAKNFLGAGTVGFRPYLTLTYGTRFSPHLNFGYEVNGDTVLVANSSGGSGHLPNRLLFSGGVDWGLTRWMTLSVDLIGHQIYDGPRIKVVPAPPVPSQGANIIYSTISPYSDTYLRGDASAGIKVRPLPSRNLIVTGNVLVRLNNDGLRSAVVPLVAVSYTF